jgi:hypothetical protein
MAIKTHTFRGLKYHVHIEHKLDGWAEVPGREPRGIYCDPTLSPKSFMETAIHEAMHAEDPDVSEKVILRRGKSMANWLWRLGYRRVE